MIIDEIKHEIKKKLNCYDINLIIFGSYEIDSINDEIDIAIITNEKQNKFKKLISEISKIKIDFLSKYNKYLDINLFSEDNFNHNLKFPFNKNVCNGDFLIKDLELDTDNSYNISHKKIIFEKCTDLFSITDLLIKNKKYGMAWSCLYYVYYHSFIYFILENEMSCNSKADMVSRLLSKLSENSIVKYKDVMNFFACENYMNLFTYNYGYSELESRKYLDEIYIECKYLVKQLFIK